MTLVTAAIALMVLFIAAWHLLRRLGVVNWRSIQQNGQIGPAATLIPTWRGTPFRVGHRYIVLERPAPPSLLHQATPGDIVTYQGSGYSRYDGASQYYFLTESGVALDWWVSDEDPIELANQYFRAVEQSST